MKWVIIGISGPTCSGKTTVAKKVHENIKDAVVIYQDKYFLSQDDSRHKLIPELNHFNWEILSSLDMSKMHSDVLKIIESNNGHTQENSTDKKNRVLIIEGFTIYNYKPLTDLFHQKYFIDISREVCWDRRKDRVYDPPDVPGYFDKVVWPEYVRHKSEITSDENFHKTITFLDGTRDINKLCEEVMNGITTLL